MFRQVGEYFLDATHVPLSWFPPVGHRRFDRTKIEIFKKVLLICRPVKEQRLGYVHSPAQHYNNCLSLQSEKHKVCVCQYTSTPRMHLPILGI